MKADLLLPKTKFLPKIKSIERASFDSKLADLVGLSSFYEWQKTLVKKSGSELRKDFALLDGPPYANGNVHVGHAINKILKDFIVKTQVLLGHRVCFRPGWDCHGLPIELKIQKESRQDDHLQIRRSCRALAMSSLQMQMTSFKRWGISADFNNPYLTMDHEYVKKELELLANLFERGFIYRAFKPVYWSPSSRSTLAESELEYNCEHRSTAVYFRYKLETVTSQIVEAIGRHHPEIFALIWTTTPWTLALNNAIAFNPSINYALVEFPEEKIKSACIYIMAEELVLETCNVIGRTPRILRTFNGQYLAGCTYQNPMVSVAKTGNITDSGDHPTNRFLPGKHVNCKKGTGLVHTSFAHGHDDYQLAISNGFSINKCFVDEDACFSFELGPSLGGKQVLGDGSKEVLNLLSNNVIHTYDYIHSYPYDWRTNKPVIIRSSSQWFIDVSTLGQQCAKLLQDESITPLRISAGDSDLRTGLLTQLTRSEWCISRQRVWGVPIPAIFHKESKHLYTSPEFIRFISKLVSNTADTDIWWKMPLIEMSVLNDFPKFPVNPEECEKCLDILDVWLDSGFAWHTLSNSNKLEKQDDNSSIKVSDIVVEGVDQLRGWFQSSLLTSMAIQGVSPFKRILVHGFAKDDFGEKMSKSKGNIVAPDTITDGTLQSDALGADGLRLWVASKAADSVGEVPIGPTMLDKLHLQVNQIRLIFRFILGALEAHKDARKKILSTADQVHLTLLDKFMLQQLKNLYKESLGNYLDYRFGFFIHNFVQFLQKPVSSIYINCVRDRLYCDRIGSERHNGAIFTIDALGQVLATLMAPITPHLIAEYLSYHPKYREDCLKSFRDLFESPITLEYLDGKIGDPLELKKVMDLVLSIKTAVGNESEKSNEKAIQKMGLLISASSLEDYRLLRSIHQADDDLNSELIEWLNCSFIHLSDRVEQDLLVKIIRPLKNCYSYCSRCRKNNRLTTEGNENMIYCRRCTEALNTEQ